MNGRDEDDLALVTARFSALWAALTSAGEGREAMIDRVRDALDRGLNRLRDDPPDLIANSFSLDETAYASDRTLVLKLRHRDLGTAHALKTLPAYRRDDVVLRHWLLNEGRLTAALSHPNILAVRAILRLADGRPALLSDWMPGTLTQLINERVLTAADIGDIMRSLFSALGYLHGRGIVHADLSPANLFFADEGCDRLMIGDFGLALRPGARLEDWDLARGMHPDFAAPEQLAGGRAETASDLYSSGRILQLLIDHCESGEDAFHRLAALAGRLTQPDPADRPQSAAEAATLLGG